MTPRTNESTGASFGWQPHWKQLSVTREVRRKRARLLQVTRGVVTVFCTRTVKGWHPLRCEPCPDSHGTFC